MRVADAVVVFVGSQLTVGTISPATARNYGPAMRALVHVAGAELEVSGLRRAHVEAWLASQAGVSASTRRSRWSMLRSFLTWAVVAGLLDSDPSVGVTPPRRPPSSPRALEPHQVARLLRAAPDARGRVIVALMVWCGLRCCEVASLDVGRTDLDGRTVTVRGKRDRWRTVPLPDEAVPYLRRWLAERGLEPGPLVTGRRWRAGQPLTADTISGLVSAWCDAAGIKSRARDGVSAHALRHTAASDVLEHAPTGAGLVIVQTMLGHEHLSTTAVYLRRPRMDAVRAAMAGRAYDAA